LIIALGEMTMYTKTSRLLAISLFLAHLALSIGCKKDEAASAEEQGSTKQAEKAEGLAKKTPAKGDDPTQAMSAKMSGYVRECINSFSSSVSDSIRRYYSWVKKDQGITGKERHVYGVFKIHGDPRKCSQAVDKANKLEPKVPDLEKAASSYAAALEALVPVVNKAYPYYDQKDYKDDKLAKGKELHPQLVKVFTDFSAANKALYAVVDEHQEKLDQVSLGAVEGREGKKMLWQVKNTIVTAKRLFKLNAYPKKLAVEKFKTELDSYAAALEAMKTYVEKNKSDKMASKADWYTRESDDLLKAGKELYRRARDSVPYSRGERMNMGGSGEWMVNGSPGKLLRAYNRVVDQYNSMMRWWR
jgi:hypothetical protein